MYRYFKPVVKPKAASTSRDVAANTSEAPAATAQVLNVTIHKHCPKDVPSFSWRSTTSFSW